MEYLKKAVSRNDGTYRDVMRKYKKPRILILDEWLLYPLKEIEARDILEIIEVKNRASFHDLPLPVRHPRLA